MNMKSKLDALNSEQRRKLIFAFDNHFAQHVELPDEHFLGVNVNSPNFTIIESVGSWSYGKIKRSKDE